MKKLLLFVVLLCAASLMAQDAAKRHSLELTFGDPMPLYITSSFYDCGCGPEEAFEDDSYPQEYHGFVLPTFNITYHYAVKPWLEVGGSIGASADATYYYQRVPIEGTPWETAKKVNYGHRYAYLMADVRFMYLRKDIVRLYSGVGLGLTFDYFDQAHKPLGTRELTCLPAVQLTAIGMQLGRKVYWSLEAGVGTKGFVNTGIGVRF